MGVIKSLVPKPCPFELVRIGGSGDGAYLIPDDLNGIDACFSPGVNNYKNFEDVLTKEHGIKCHMCDFSSDPGRFSTALIEGMQTFKKKWLDIDGGDDSISLSEWINEYSPDPNQDLILQIDIEGAEYRNILSADKSLMNRFRIIVIELHEFGAFKKPELLSQEIEPLLRKFDETHLCVHAHPNNCCGDFIDLETGLNIPNVIEVTYLRKDRFSGDQSRYIQPSLPHPQDISYNVRENPPIHLNEKWLSSGKRSIESTIKILQDNLDYAKWENDHLKSMTSSETDELFSIFRQSIANLAETVYSSALSSDVDNIDIAYGKRYFVSKSYGAYPSEGIVREDPQFFFHTAIEKRQYITIDLGQSRVLHKLVISNRKDACQDRASALFCFVHEEREFFVKDALPVVVTDDFVGLNGSESVTPLFGKQGRYLTIFSPIRTALHFSSIKVF